EQIDLKMPDAPQISVIISTYLRCALVERSLRALCSQTLVPTVFEVIVVVDGSDDDVDPEAGLLGAHLQAHPPGRRLGGLLLALTAVFPAVLRLTIDASERVVNFATFACEALIGFVVDYYFCAN